MVPMGRSFGAWPSTTRIRSCSSLTTKLMAQSASCSDETRRQTQANLENTVKASHGYYRSSWPCIQTFSNYATAWGPLAVLKGEEWASYQLLSSKIVNIGIRVAATFHINVFGALPSRYGFDNTAIRADFDLGKNYDACGKRVESCGCGMWANARGCARVYTSTL
jgi:hypothetical protein